MLTLHDLACIDRHDQTYEGIQSFVAANSDVHESN